MFQNQRLMEKIKTNLLLMDKMILFFVYSLVTISTIFVYSATRSQKFVMQNLIWIGLGTFLMFLISFMDYKEYKDHIWKIYGLSAVLLILVRIAPIISLRLFIPFLYFSTIQNAIITIIAIFTNSDG